MPKKKKSKALKETKESAVVEEVTSSTAPKKVSHEIDEIFSGKKRKKREHEKADEGDKNETEKPKLRKKKKKKIEEDREGRFTEPASKPRRKTADGFTVYTEEDLGINNSNAGAGKIDIQNVGVNTRIHKYDYDISLAVHRLS